MKGATTSSRVPLSSPTAAASVSRPAGPPANCSSNVQEHAVEAVEPRRVDLESVEREVGELGVDRGPRPALHLGEVAHAPQQAVRDARRPARAAGQLAASPVGERDAEEPGETLEDLRQILAGLELLAIDVGEDAPELAAVDRGRDHALDRSQPVAQLEVGDVVERAHAPEGGCGRATPEATAGSRKSRS